MKLIAKQFLVWSTITSILILFLVFVTLIGFNKNAQNTKEFIRLQSNPNQMFEIVRNGKRKEPIYLKSLNSTHHFDQKPFYIHQNCLHDYNNQFIDKVIAVL